MDEIIVRVATLKDLDTMFVFEQAIVSAERPFDSTLKSGIIHYYDLAAMIGAADVQLLVAEINNEIIGSGYARIEKAKDYLRHPQYAHLGFMYTDPRYRGKGVNRKILDALKQWAGTQNITELRLEVYPENIQAVKAYEKAGFSSHLLEMRMELK